MKFSARDNNYGFGLTLEELTALLDCSKLEMTFLQQTFYLEGRKTDSIDVDFSPNGSSFANASRTSIGISLGVLKKVKSGERASTQYDGCNQLEIYRDDQY